ncbi:MAG: tetratricopeptide repeat protein [Candidatus Palauibacterales bacterium]|nr:tetratricopeptide repeat protein [Candidatus Palauibacterales bacterium]
MKNLIHEIHRRSLWQVLGIYAVGSWVALQVVDVIGQNFGLPDWFPAFALGLLVIGLPIVLATAFVQEGVRGSEPPAADAPSTAASPSDAAPLQRSPRDTPFTWRNAIFGGVGAFALWGVGAAGWMLFGPGADSGAAAGTDVAEAAAARDLRSVAVLPFATRTTSEEDEYFAEGMHDDLLTQLAKIDSLKVISRTSVMEYKGVNRNIRQIAEELGVATVVEGGVQRAGNRVRINMQLIEAATDRHLWAETYDEELTAANVFAIQSDLAKKIASALQATLTPEVALRIEERPTESLEAYDLYVRGRFILDNRGSTREGVESAAALYRQAIEADATYALAYAELANTYLQLFNLGYLSESEALPEAQAAVERALELSPDLAAARIHRAELLRLDLRPAEAAHELERVLELNPGSADAHSRYSAVLLTLGRPEAAVSEARRAVELDPLSVGLRRSLVARLAWVRDYDGTIEESRNLLELEPTEADAHYYAGMAQTIKGDLADAIESFSEAIELNPDDPYYPAGIAWAYAKDGNREQALVYIRRAEAAGVPLKEIGLVYGSLGDLDTAFDYLERGFEAEPGTLANIAADPSADPLRDDPRWDELLEKLARE